MFHAIRFILSRSLTPLVGLQLAATLLCAQQPEAPKAPEELVVAIEEGQPPLSFVRLPRMTDIYGVVTGQTAAEGQDPYSTNAIYLAQTEMSLATLKSLLNDASWKRYQASVLSLMGTDKDPKWGPYRDAVREGAADLPAVCIGVTEIVEICRKLNDEPRLQGAKLDLRIETPEFRIPSRLEWQFAARGVSAPADRAPAVDFPRWIDYAQVPNLKGKIEDLQSELDPDKEPNAAAVANPAALLTLLDRGKDAGNNAAYEILGIILQNSLGFEANIAKAEESGVRQILAAAPSPWGFHRMLGNVAEWVLTAPTLAAVETRWGQLIQAVDLSALSGEEFGIVMGGNFISLKQGYRGWLKYSVAGGDPVDPSSNAPEPYQVGECLVAGGAGIDDTNGGLRLALTRTLADDWFLALRGDTFLRRADDPVDQVAANFTRTIREIGGKDSVDADTKLIAFYHDLTLNRENFSPEQWNQNVVKLDTIKKRYRIEKKAAVFSKSTSLADRMRMLSKADSDGAGSKVDFFTISRELATMDVESPAKE